MDTRALEALSDENRLAIIGLLTDGEKCLCDISDALGISGALASHHVKKLRDAGLVDARRKGTWLHCSLRREALLGVADELREIALRSVPESGAAACCGGKEDCDE